MKAKGMAMFMLGGIGLGAAATAFIMSNNQTKQKATRLINSAMNTAEQKLNRMS